MSMGAEGAPPAAIGRLERQSRRDVLLPKRGYSVRTHEAYLAAVAGLASYFRRSPVHLSVEEVKDYLRHLAVKRSLSGSTCR